MFYFRVNTKLIRIFPRYIRQIFLWIIQILDFSASGQASLVAASTASAGASTLLWTKTQQLPEEAFRQLHSIYSDHFPIEARHHLAGTYFFQVYMIFLKEKVYADYSF